MQQWQPIETAPKDGRKVMGARDGIVEIYWWNQDQYVRNPKPFWERATFVGKRHQQESQPTHWMPLPEPPDA